MSPHYPRSFAVSWTKSRKFQVEKFDERFHSQQKKSFLEFLILHLLLIAWRFNVSRQSVLLKHRCPVASLNDNKSRMRNWKLLTSPYLDVNIHRTKGMRMSINFTFARMSIFKWSPKSRSRVNFPIACVFMTKWLRLNSSSSFWANTIHPAFS